MEQVSGVITGLGSPTEKKRLVEITEPGRDYPKKLRVWTKLQDGTPNYLNAQVEEAFAGAKPVSIAYEVSSWKTQSGEDRSQNVIVSVDTGDVSTLNSSSPATGPTTTNRTNPEQPTSQEQPLPSQPTAPALDLLDLAGALRAAIATIDDVSLALEGEAKTDPPIDGRAKVREMVQQLSGELPDVAPEQDWKAWS